MSKKKMLYPEMDIRLNGSSGTQFKTTVKMETPTDIWDTLDDDAQQQLLLDKLKYIMDVKVVTFR